MNSSKSRLLDVLLSNAVLAQHLKQIGFEHGLELTSRVKDVDASNEDNDKELVTETAAQIAPSISEQAVRAGILTKLRLNSMDVRFEGLDEQLSDKSFHIDLGNSKTLLLKPGVSVIMGKSGYGKTLFTKTVVHDLQPDLVELLSFGEPDFGSIASELELYQRILDSDKEVIVIDSIRRFSFSGSGATGKGGVNMSLFMILTYWDLLGKATGRHFMIVVNPLSMDDEFINQLLEVAKGSVSIAMFADAIGSLTVSGRYLAQREPIGMSYSTAALSREKKAQQSEAKQSTVLATPKSEFAELYTFNHQLGRTGDK